MNRWCIQKSFFGANALFLMISLFIWLISTAQARSSIIITKEHDNICLSADQASIEDIGQSLKKEFGIIISGAEWPKDKLISLHICENIESLVRRIFRSIPEESYVLIFEGKSLVAIYTTPGSNRPATELHIFRDAPQKTAKPKEINAARVDMLSLGPAISQLWEFQVNDLILSYNGTQITRGPLELVELMKTTQDYQQIEIEVARNNVTQKVLIPGGILNISVVTQTITLN